MKFIRIIPLLLLPLFGCGHRDAGLRSRIDSISANVEANPDAVCARLDSLRDTVAVCGKDLRMHYLLALADAQNKAELKVVGADTMEEVADYYREQGDAHIEARAAYLLGCSYRDEGDAVLAMESYHKAAECCDTTKADADFRLMSRIYGQMSAIYRQQLAPRQEMDCLRSAVSLAGKAGDSVAAAIYYLNIGSTYERLGNRDSLLIVLRNADKLCRRICRPDLSAGAMEAVAYYSLMSGRISEAAEALARYERDSGLFAGDSIRRGYEAYHYCKGLCLLRQGDTSGAIRHFRLLQARTANIYDKELAFRGLVEAYGALRDVDSVVRYSRLASDAADTSRVRDAAEAVHKAERLYNYRRISRRADDSADEAWRYRLTLAATALLGLLAGAVGCRLLMHQRRLLAQSRESLGRYKAEETREAAARREQELLASGPVRALRDTLAEGKTPSEGEWSTVAAAVAEHQPALWRKLNSAEADLTRQELRITLLTRLGFPPAGIAQLVCVSRQRVSNVRSILNTKLFGGDGAKGLESGLQRT